MRHFKTALALILLSSCKLGADDSPSSRPISPEERLSRIEGQIAVLLEEVRALRREINGGVKPQGPGGSVAMEETMVLGCVVKTYVRTGGADIASPPPPKATPSDERPDSGTQFSARAQAAAAGYENQPVTVIWDGYLKVEEKDVYEFIFTGVQGTIRIGRDIISQKETSTRLELTPGYWPIQVLDYYYVRNFSSQWPSFSVKRSGLDPLPMNPGTLWTPETK